jgi:predicted anti-sigma-YlaC factor YlaD
VHNSGPPQIGHAAGDLDLALDEITCQQFVELVTDYFEGTLQARTLSQVEEHLVMCDWCVTYVEQMRTAIASLRELADQRSPEPPGPVLAAWRARSAGEP